MARLGEEKGDLHGVHRPCPSRRQHDNLCGLREKGRKAWKKQRRRRKKSDEEILAANQYCDLTSRCYVVNQTPNSN